MEDRQISNLIARVRFSLCAPQAIVQKTDTSILDRVLNECEGSSPSSSHVGEEEGIGRRALCSVFAFLRLLNMIKGSSAEYGYFVHGCKC